MGSYKPSERCCGRGSVPLCCLGDGSPPEEWRAGHDWQSQGRTDILKFHYYYRTVYPSFFLLVSLPSVHTAFIIFPKLTSPYSTLLSNGASLPTTRSCLSMQILYKAKCYTIHETEGNKRIPIRDPERASPTDSFLVFSHVRPTFSLLNSRTLW